MSCMSEVANITTEDRIKLEREKLPDSVLFRIVSTLLENVI